MDILNFAGRITVKPKKKDGRASYSHAFRRVIKLLGVVLLLSTSALHQAKSSVTLKRALLWSVKKEVVEGSQGRGMGTGM